MYRYTTAKINYKLISVVDFDNIAEVWVTIGSSSSNKRTWKLSKEEVKLDKEENAIVLELSQVDTAMFKEGIVETQFRIGYKDGRSMASTTKKFEITRVLEDGVMNIPTNDTNNTPSDPGATDPADPTDPPSGTTDPSDPSGTP